MAVKLSGAEYKRFFNDTSIWGGEDSDTYVDDDVISVNGTVLDDAARMSFDPDTLADDALVEVSNGFLANPPKGVPEDLVDAIRYWKRKQSMRTILVEVDASKLDAVLAAIKAAGGKAVK